MKLQRLLCLFALSLTLISNFPTRAQEATLRIYGVGYGEGAHRADGSDLTEIPVEVSNDRHVRFRLTVSVRNFGTVASSYKLQVRAWRARSAASPVYEVEKGVARREPYDVDLDFGSGGGDPYTVYVPPRNPVRAELLLFNADGREIGRRAFNLILSFPRSPTEPPTLRRDLTVESARLVYTPVREFRVGRIREHVDAFMTIRNVGSETWGFRGTAMLLLQLGTPETRLEDLGAPGMPTERSLPLPTGLSPRALNTVSALLETRFRNEVRIGPAIVRGTPPLRPGTWYTHTAAIASEADLDPTNDAVQFVFMLNDDKSIRESRTVRVTTRVRVVTR
jgi:hypothetical protein